jgi:AmmeMemoRadiSam system protein B
LYLPGCALSQHAKYSTPLGDLLIDQELVGELQSTDKFDTMSKDADETEHSLEMHLPYIYKMLSRSFSSPSEYPKLIPILVGNTNHAKEKEYGAMLAPYLSDPSNVFVISSDFCHWGSRFQYTYYLPASPSAVASSNPNGISLRRKDKAPTEPPIHESIGRLDRMAMDAIESGKHEAFLGNLKETGNTVCGRHPIGVIMAAIEVLEQEGKAGEGGKGSFKFVRYERSSDVTDVGDSSVSYASAYSVV